MQNSYKHKKQLPPSCSPLQYYMWDKGVRQKFA